VDGARILEIGAIEGERALAFPAAAPTAEGFELFALFPAVDSRGAARWLGEMRRDTADSVELSFFEADDGLDGSARPIAREVFESALSPKKVSSLQGLDGKSLSSALAALGTGPFLVRFRSSSGLDAWYLSGGRAEDASQAWAWSPSPGRVLALSASGSLVDASAGSMRKFELGSPAKGASYTGLAAASGILAAAWEVGSFPKVEAAGLVIAPLDL